MMMMTMVMMVMMMMMFLTKTKLVNKSSARFESGALVSNFRDHNDNDDEEKMIYQPKTQNPNNRILIACKLICIQVKIVVDLN